MSNRMLALPRFYPILDAELVARRGLSLAETAQAMRDAGVTLLQYRDKTAPPAAILRNADLIRAIFADSCTLILDDRADLAALAGWHGVHVGQLDLSPAGARAVMGQGIIGLSTHTDDQLRAGESALAAIAGPSYLAIGPVFATSTKLNPDPVVGLDGVRRARSLTTRPLVAIGGITRATAPTVLAAGATSIAVISDALGTTAEDTRIRCADWLALLQ